jgi:hypothetical protein
MSAAVELIPLVCTRCQTAVPAQVDEVAWVCANCGQGLLLDDQLGAAPLEVHFAAGLKAGQKGHPFWVTRGTVTIQSRRIFGGGDQSGAGQQYWAQARTFLIPAFACTLDQVVQFGTDLLAHPPALQEGSAGAFEAVVTLPDEVKAYAEFIVMGIETGRKDKLKELNFQIQLEPAQLWIMP